MYKVAMMTSGIWARCGSSDMFYIVDHDENEDEARMLDSNQLAAAAERLRRWAQWVAARVGALTRPHAPPPPPTDSDGVAWGGGLEATSSADTACDLAAAASPDGQRSSPRPTVLVDCSHRQVI